MGNFFAALTALALATASPPPPKSLPGSKVRAIPAEVAIKRAKQLGPGTCDDLRKIQGLPYPGQFGWDPYVDRIMIHISSYKPCLFQSTASTKPVHIVGFPGVSPRTEGDLAHILLLHAKVIPWNRCLPKEVKAREARGHWPNLYQWLATPVRREKWHKCLLKGMAPNNSFKPNPLRGSA